MKLSEDKNLDAPVTEVMDYNVVILDDSASINEAARGMEENGVTSILVRDSESGKVTGIVTERDIIYRAVAKSLGMYKAKIKKL